MRVKIGDKVRGKSKERYKIIDRLRAETGDIKGGMGVVFVAETTSKPETEVIIKFAKQSEDDQPLIRLHREAELLRDFKKSKPKNIVSYIDEAHESEKEFFVVMEKLEGQDLETKIGSKALDEKRVLKFSKDIAHALNYLHTCTDVDPPFLIHRDLKPDNIIIVKRNGEEHCVLIDFGTGKKGVGITNTSTYALGTKIWSCKHNFWDPGRVGVDCDIYALGRVMFYMATGLKPKDYEITHGDRSGCMEYKAERFGLNNVELSNLIDDMIDYPDHKKIQTAAEVVERLELLKPSMGKPRTVQSKKYTSPQRRQQQQPQLLQGPHIILGGRRYPITGDHCEIGRAHTCPDPDDDCSRGILHQGMDGFDYPHKPDIEIPLTGPLQQTVAESHHIRIWKDNGQWYVKDLDTINYSAILKNNNWIMLNDEKTGKGKTMTLDENFTKLAIGYRSGGRTEIEFSFYKQ